MVLPPTTNIVEPRPSSVIASTAPSICMSSASSVSEYPLLTHGTSSTVTRMSSLRRSTPAIVRACHSAKKP